MIKVGDVAYVSMRLDETDTVTITIQLLFPRLQVHFLKYYLHKKLVISP